MVLDLSPDAILFAILLILLRILNTGIGTVRLILVTRQQKVLASLLAIVEALLFALSIGSVANDLNNVLNLAAYCGGFAIGNYIGMIIERRFITSYMTVNIITPQRGHEIALALRQHGYGVTETLGEGHQGAVTMLRSVVLNRDVPKVLQIVGEMQEDAFVAVEEARSVYRGWLRSVRNSQ
ncbi:MAG: DUF2179 domain-containing protein [Chloroflexi bacterium]|uniref:DUF2179 domain-containing protein n=1 Tax=Candidatus Flexifilum breve TaxID=3140694 RepID=UPI003135CC00|nr:DUF2179 domain-containing protein [Chloroflexota bacterium]